MRFIRQIIQQLGLSPREGGGGAKRFCLPLLALICAAALGSWLLMRPSSAAITPDTKWYAKNPDAEEFYISTSADLAGLAGLVNTSRRSFSGKTIHLSADIDLGGEPWTPIGKNETYVFQGIFDGGGHAVTGLYINGSKDYRGLFGYISSATVKDLSVSGSVSGGDCTGAVVGYAFSATVKDLSVSGSVSGGNYTGAVVGYADTSRITNCVSDAAVSGGSYVGGIAGNVRGSADERAYISGCVNGGRVSGREINIGGIAGALSDAIARDCANAGAVTGGGSGYSGIGGIAGYGSDAGVVNCLNRGDARADAAYANAGGIIGYYRGITAELCTNMGRVYSGGYAGGILGRHDSGVSTVASCASVGGVSGGVNTGAIVGEASSTGPYGEKEWHATLSNCLWYESGPVNAGLKAAGDDNNGKITSAMAASADNYGTLAATYAPDPASAMIPQGKTKTLFRSWPGVNTSAVTAVSYDVSPDTGLTLRADVNKSVTATMTTSGDYTVSATAEFTTSLLASATQSQHTTEKMTLRVGEGWPYLPVVYVTPNGTGEKDGSSWANAMGGADFSAMLKWINRQNSGTAYEFRVAAGTYAQSETLPLPKGVKLYGGFAGTETDIDAREIKNNVTILSRNAALPDDVKFSIVTAEGGATSADTVLDGFTITGGTGTHAGGNYYVGGGMVLDKSSPAIINCEFSNNNVPTAGGAVYMEFSAPYIKNCAVTNNVGGGIYGQDSSIIAEGCVFRDNVRDGGQGGGVSVTESDSTNPLVPTTPSSIKNCSFIGNSAQTGGGLFTQVPVSIINTTFHGNRAKAEGGAIHTYGALSIANSTFSGNSAVSPGGAINTRAKLAVINSIFHNNSSNSGNPEIHTDSTSATATLQNCVITEGGAGGTATITSSDIFTGDPKFLNDSPVGNGGPVPTMAVSAGGSAYRAGLKPGASFTGADGKTYTTPLTDARGVSFDVTSADIGAYAWKAEGFSVSGSLELAAGASADLAPYAGAKLVSTDVLDTNAGRAAVWTSTSADIATVADGVASGVAKGKTTFTATFGGLTASGSLPVTVFAAHGDVTEERMTDTPDANGYGSGVIAVSSDARESIAIYDALGLLSADQKLPANIDPAAKPIDASSVDVTTSADIYTSADIRGAVARYLSIDAEAEGDSPYKVRLVQVNNTVASRAGEGDTLFAKFWRFLTSFFGNDGEQAKHADDYLPLQTNFVISEDQLPGHLAYRFGRQKDGDQFTSDDMTEFIREVNPFVVVRSGDAVEARSLYDIVSGDVTKYITVERAGTTDTTSNIDHFTYTIKTRVLLFNKAGAVTEGAGKEFVMPVTLSDDAKTRESGNYFLVEDGAEDDRYDLCLAFAVKTPKVLHVKPNGGDGNNSGDGATWGTALTSADFADRLRQINGKVRPDPASYYAADEYGYEFWVASGDYKPTADDYSGYYFALTSNVRLYGGFAGTERSVDGRAAGNVSTLNGKLANVKARDVLYGTEVKGAVVDGFTVSGGANGLYLENAEVRISGCRVKGNTERGFYALSSRLEIESSLIAANGDSGIWCESGAVTLKDSTLTGNKTEAAGGAVLLQKWQGGTCALRAENCTFSGNSAESNGGAVSFAASSGELLLANCTFSGNSAGTEGGAIANPPAGFKIYNTLFAGNSASRGKDVDAPNQGELVNCRFDADGIYAGNITSTDCTTADALLLTASPDDNGGPVPTMAVSAGGSAFRAGATPGTVISGDFKTPLTDARGVSFDKAHAEIGAYAYEIASADASVKTDAPEELILGTSSDIGKVFSLAAHLTKTASPDRYAAAFNITSAASDVVSVDNGALYALKTGSSTVTAESTKGTQADGNPVEFSEATKTLKVAISVASLGISETPRVIRRGASALFSLVLPNGYTSADIESRDIAWSLTTGTDYSITPSADGLSATVTAGNVSFGASSTITATIAGKTSGETKMLTADVSTPVGETPKPPVTPANRTDGAGGESGSGILDIIGTSEDFAIYDAMKDLSAATNLPGGISADAKPIGATSADVVTSEDLFSAEQIKAAVTEYWGLGAASEDRVRLVEVQNTVASRADEGGTLFAKVWRFLVSLFTQDGGNEAPGASDYLPIEAHFTIGSADIAALPDEVKDGLSAGNLLSKVNLFAVVSEDGKVSARSLADAASGDLAAYITVSGGNDAGYTVQTRVMLFDMEGGVSGDAEADKAAGAKWVQPLKAASSDARPNDKDNYFIVQDGAEDDRYDLCLAFAAKEPNYAEVSVTASGDIESKDIEYVRWTVSGDAAQHEAGSSADIRGGEQSVTLIVPDGCHVTLSDETQTLSRDVKMISADVTWGGEWKITALFEKIKAESVTLDKTTLALAVGGSYKLTAKAAPAEAYANYALWAWTTSDGNVAEVAADGTVTAKAAGKATITAAANDGSGAKADCAVTVRKSAADDPAVTPAEPEAVKPEVVTPNENVVPVTPGYVTDPVKQEDVMNEIGLKAEDAAVTENGSLTVAGALADKAAEEVIANDPDTVSKDSVISLPVTVSSADEAGMIHALGFKVSGDVFGKVDGVGEIRVLKIFTDGGGKAFTVVTAAEAIADKTVALYDANNEIVTGAIDAAATYTLTAFVLDGGEYDLDGKTDGKVIDPIAIIKQAEPPVSPTPTPTGGSGGGCNAGAGALALAALIPLAVRRGKR